MDRAFKSNDDVDSRPGAESTKLVDSEPVQSLQYRRTVDQSRVYLWGLGVVDVNRVPPTRDSKDGSVVKELAEVLGIQGGR